MRSALHYSKIKSEHRTIKQDISDSLDVDSFHPRKHILKENFYLVSLLGVLENYIKGKQNIEIFCLYFKMPLIRAIYAQITQQANHTHRQKHKHTHTHTIHTQKHII